MGELVSLTVSFVETGEIGWLIDRDVVIHLLVFIQSMSHF
jgi:hypothetical protein